MLVLVAMMLMLGKNPPVFWSGDLRDFSKLSLMVSR